jgi:hypothetical protein
MENRDMTDSAVQENLTEKSSRQAKGPRGRVHIFGYGAKAAVSVLSFARPVCWPLTMKTGRSLHTLKSVRLATGAIPTARTWRSSSQTCEHASDVRYPLTTKFMQGNEAVGWGALAAGCRFYAGYPITPSTEIAEMLSRELPKLGGKFIQMEDEIASLAAIIGASVGGLKSMTATSGPGFSLDAGEHRVCRHDRNPLRDRRCAAPGAQHRPAHQRLAG